MINKNELERLKYSAGFYNANEGLKLYNFNKVKILAITFKTKSSFTVYAEVEENKENYNIELIVENGKIKNADCDCNEFYGYYMACKHVYAVALAIYHYNLLPLEERKRIEEEGKYIDFKKLVNTFYNIEDENEDIQIEEPIKNTIEPHTVKIVPSLEFDIHNDELKLELKIGVKQLYRLKDLSQFYDAMTNNKNYKYGAKLEFIHSNEMFEENSIPLLNFILKYAKIIQYANNYGKNENKYKYYSTYKKSFDENCIMLSPEGFDELFEILKGQQITFKYNYEDEIVEFCDEQPNINFEIIKINDEEYKISEENIRYFVIEGIKNLYLICNGKLYRCDNNFKNTTLKMLEVFDDNKTNEIIFNKKYLPEFFTIVMPNLKDNVSLSTIKKEEIEQYMPQELGVKVFLDVDEKLNIVAKITFCYGDTEFNPFDENYEPKGLIRNIIEERKVVKHFAQTGFLLNKEKQYIELEEEDKIYNFLYNDINKYMEKYEVLITDNFKSRQVRQPKIGSLGVKIENNLLNIDLKDLDFDISELQDIMKNYKIKKKYHRLKDGAFLNLEQNEELDLIDNLISGMEFDYKDIKKGKIRVPVHRSLYLNKLLENLKDTRIVTDKTYKEIIDNTSKNEQEDNITPPKELENILRTYQLTGYKWLKVLDKYKFGGVLADDMGLGKTLQIISLILAYKQETKKEELKPSIVICPSSLTLNWKNEIEKFAGKNLTVNVIRGKAEERELQIKKYKDTDIVITSYDLLKRDIDIYEDIDANFKYVIADEAQYAKNSNTQNAKALKLINGETKYALTGTPIENSLSELWSIYDYIMPGYLFNYNKFKKDFETPIVKDNDEDKMKKLKMLIEPFILRRHKKEVLTELPEKTITILNNEMEDEQQKIYLSYYAQTKQEIMKEISQSGFEKSQIKILALLTRLRQICCHPSLFIENYKGESSKLNQCIEIIKDATESGHKILLFSGYTAMFEILEKELNKEGISYYELTGQTKVDERIKLVDDFNKSETVKVFLISLKAGGTGLNLTGADMVIHYDPWWNSSAENQATDRAYRIGQKNNVQVYKLITKNSIEEKINELQEKKSKLIDNMLSTEETFINKLSKEDIMMLFE